MNFKEVVTMAQLVEGDRFYKPGDAKKKKLVVTKMEWGKEKPWSTPRLTVTVKDADAVDKAKDTEHVFGTIIQNAEEKQVVFLRHKEAIA